MVLYSLILSNLLLMQAQTAPPEPIDAAAVLPLPEKMRAEATIVERGIDGQYKIIHKGGNGLMCSAAKTPTGEFHASCYQELIFAAQMRHVALSAELRKGGKPADTKTVDVALAAEIKTGKIKLPDHPTTGYRLAGPFTGYDTAANTVSKEIDSWQMIIVPFATGQMLSLPEEHTMGMPWVMNSGTWIAHIMVEH